jgi:hypothetical protein
VENEKKKSGLTRFVIERLHNPLQLRVIVCAGLPLAWYFLYCTPRCEDIAAKTDRLQHEEKRLALANDIEQLRARLKPIKDRFPAKVDPTEYLQYVLGGIRGLPLKLIKLDQAPQINQGPYQVIVLRIDVEGTYGEVHKLVRWIEDSKRPMRVDSIKIEPRTMGGPPTDGALSAHLTVLGIMG